MKKTHLVTIYLFHILGDIIQMQCRKYDIDAEALKLYGENVDRVVQRFRKTADYRRILNDKMKESDQLKKTIITQAVETYAGKLVNDINKALATAEKGDQTILRTHINYGHRKSLHPFGYQYKIKDRLLGQDDNIVETTTLSPIEILDAIVADSALTVAEKNQYKNMAFQYFGETVHAIIRGMGPDDEDTKSTRLIQGNGNEMSTTEHPIIHEVTEAQTSSTSEVSTILEQKRQGLIRRGMRSARIKVR